MVSQVAQDCSNCCAAAETGVPRVLSNLLVLGLGNTLLGDDGVGIRVVEDLQAQSAFAGASYIDGGTLSFSLLGHLEQADAMLVIDAAQLDAAPGTVCVFEDAAMDRFLASSRRRSVHEVGLSDLLDMARLEDCLPQRRALVCVQPANIGWSQSLSAPVAEARLATLAQASAILARWSGRA